MPIEPGQFMLYWAGGLVLFVLLVFGRPRRRGMRLRLTAGSRQKGVVTYARGSTPAAAPTSPGERPLNVIFQFNGHSWDAYEVLGLPAGSNYDTVRAAYEESLETVDATSRPFMEAAFRAIVTAMKA